MRNMFNTLLVLLCMADLLVIFTILILCSRSLFAHNPLPDILYTLSEGLCHVAISASIFMTITITVERYYAVSHPFSYQVRLEEKGSRWILSCYLIPVLLGSILLNIPKLLQISRVLPTIFGNSQKTLIKAGIIYQVVHPFTTTCILPIIIFIIFNYHIVNASKRRMSPSSKMALEINLAKIMMKIVIIFIILNIPRVSLSIYEVSTIPNILECYERHCRYHISSYRWLLDKIIRYLVILNSSSNFAIYCFAGSKFRTTLNNVGLKPFRRLINDAGFWDV